MQEGHFDDEIWNEHEWEKYLNEIEQRSEQLRKFIASDSDNDHPRWLSLLEENPDILDAIDAFIEEELQIEDAYLPEDEQWDEWEEELDDAYWDELEEEDLFFDEMDEEEDFDAGEEWKELSDDFTLSDNGSIENLGIYSHARELAVHILKWAGAIHPKFRSAAFSEFINNILKIGAKLAGGYSFGFDLDYLGANIANTKKSLYAANRALQLLEDEIKGSPHLTPLKYKELHEQLFELRNDIGIYVQELREQFNRGFE